jgi:hypothetical protein
LQTYLDRKRNEKWMKEWLLKLLMTKE